MKKNLEKNNTKNKLVTSTELTVEQVTKDMLVYGNEPYTTSKEIAKCFGVRHDNLLAKIRSFHSYDKLVKSLKIKEQKESYRGREFPYFELDADAFAFTCLSITGQKAESFKWVFIEAFKKATAEVISTKAAMQANTANQKWLESREHGKDTRKLLQDKIKEFCKYAEKQRGKPYKICPFYKLVTDAIYTYLGVEVPKAGKITRDVYSGDMIEEIERAELKVTKILDEVILVNGSRKGLKDFINERLDTEMLHGVG